MASQLLIIRTTKSASMLQPLALVIPSSPATSRSSWSMTILKGASMLQLNPQLCPWYPWPYQDRLNATPSRIRNLAASWYPWPYQRSPNASLLWAVSKPSVLQVLYLPRVFSSGALVTSFSTRGLISDATTGPSSCDSFSTRRLISEPAATSPEGSLSASVTRLSL